MTVSKYTPSASYAVLQQEISESALDEVAESVKNIGYGILDSGYASAELKNISDEFNRTHKSYVETYGEYRLKSLNEIHTIRSPLTDGGETFLRLALNENQNFVSTTPLAINALFCVDDFTFENGATFVLPASHKSEDFPSAGYIEKNAVQVAAKSGSFIILDCMMFHAGGYNATQSA